VTGRSGSRWKYLALALLTVALGLALRWLGDDLTRAIRDIAGDALWAAMMFWWVSALAPAARLWNRIAFALLVSAGVELAQLYRSPLLNSVRSTTIGHLVLGTDFDARDLAAYTLGVSIAALIDRFFNLRSARRRRAA
jgi:hypothetical protein